MQILHNCAKSAGMVFLIVIMVHNGCGQSGMWRIDDGAGFSMQIPDGFSEPVQLSRQVPTRFGPLTLHSWQTESPVAMAMIQFCDYPADYFRGKPLNQLYDEARTGSLSMGGGTVLREESGMVDGLPGRTVWIEVSTGLQHLHSRLSYIFRGSRLYVCAMIAKDSAYLSSAEALEYFSSVRFRR